MAAPRCTSDTFDQAVASADRSPYTDWDRVRRGAGSHPIPAEERPVAPSPPTAFRLGPTEVDLDRRVVVRDGVETRLSPLEAGLLGHLAARPGRLVYREELLTQVWGYHPDVITRAVANTVRRLRRKIETDPRDPQHLVSVYGGGTMLEGITLPATASPRGPGGRFIGRAAEQARVAQAFADGARLVTLLGPGGAGKTRLARVHAETRPAVWVDLAPTREADAVAEAVAQGLGVRRPDLAPLLRLHTGLLILDNAEQVADAVANHLTTWLARPGPARFLVTSRERLGVDGEVCVAVGPLPPDDAVALFCDRAAAAGGAVAPEAAAPIVARLDGLPLAIEMAAARVSALSPAVLLAQLGAPLDLLRSGRRAPPRRHATMRAVVAWSWDLLPAAGRDALAALSVFRGRFRLDAAAAVLGEDGALDRVQALLDRSLLQRADTPEGAPGFRHYDAVRAFAAEARRASPDAGAVHLRFVAWARSVPAPRAGEEIENLRAALALAETPEAVAALATRLAPVVARRDSLATALAVLDRVPTPCPPGFSAQVTLCRAGLMRSAGDGAGARALLDGLLGGPVDAEARCELGELALMEGRLDAAAALLARAHAGTDSPALHARIEELEAVRHRFAEDWTAALKDLRSAERRHAAAGDVRGVARCQAGTAAALRAQGRLTDAARTYRSAIAAFEAVGDAASAATTRGNLGLVHAAVGDLDLAAVHYRAALARHRARGQGRSAAIVLVNLARLRTANGDPAGAEAALADARDLAGNDPRVGGHIQAHRGILRLHQDRPREARALLSEAIEGLAARGFQAAAESYRAWRSIAQVALGEAPPPVDAPADLAPLCRAWAGHGDLDAALADAPVTASEGARMLAAWITARRTPS